MSENTTIELGRYDQPIKDKRLNWVLFVVCINILLFGAIFAVDWTVVLYEWFNLPGLIFPKPWGFEQTFFTGTAKAVNSVLCLVIVLMVMDSRIDKKDWIQLLLAFLFIVPTDVIMRIIDLSPALDASSPIFMVGGVTSILAHFVLFFRHGRGFPYWRKKKRANLPKKNWFQILWLPVVIFGSAAVALGFLWKYMVPIDHQIIGPAYTFFFCMNTWVVWETVRYNLYPKRNAYFAAIGVTLWYLTEIVGEIFNVQIGLPSAIAFQFIWMVYGPGILLIALSGIKYKK
jgi:hypothetical protein